MRRFEFSRPAPFTALSVVLGRVWNQRGKSNGMPVNTMRAISATAIAVASRTNAKVEKAGAAGLQTQVGRIASNAAVSIGNIGAAFIGPPE